ncbi:MAG TPA: S41 family peptidase [Oculatellaceae cyanobacterium]
MRTWAPVFCSLALSLLAGCSWLGLDPSNGNSQPSLANRSQQVAEALYDEAWNMVRDEYVDPSFNGQDWNQWRHHFKGRLQDAEDAYVAIGTMIASLNDEYTRFLLPRDMKEQTMSIDSKLYGVGVQISMRDNKLVVMATIDGTPAERAGLMPKDQIIRIDGLETAGLSVEDAADRIRGEKGTYVTLTVKRGNQEFEKRIQRDEIKLKSVFTKPLSDKRIGYIRLSSFISENMLNEMRDVNRQMIDKQALILDLRGNYGGLFTNAVEIADMFLDRGDIVSIVNREHEQRRYVAKPGVVTQVPLVILIDGGSASASEILSGALKDNRRATLIGTQSFGKGLVQKINTLSDGTGLNITISKYLTPNGTDINKKGITPDITVPYTEADFLAQRDPQLDRAIRFLQSKLAAQR